MRPKANLLGLISDLSHSNYFFMQCLPWTRRQRDIHNRTKNVIFFKTYNANNYNTDDNDFNDYNDLYNDRDNNGNAAVTDDIYNDNDYYDSN